VSHSTEPVEGRNQRYSHVGMPRKPISSPSTDAGNRRRGTSCQIIEFPKPSGSEVRQAGLTIVFELDERQFEIDWNRAKVNQKPGKLIPMLRKGR
jgi:hypothetical protein